MSVIIRLQNLPWSANAADIRGFFKGLSIPEGGVHIVGGEQGDAFIAFSTDEDARQAMMNDGGKIKEVQVKLLLSSRSEMHKVIEMARQNVSFLQLPAQPAVVQQPQAQVPMLPMQTANLPASVQGFLQSQGFGAGLGLPNAMPMAVQSQMEMKQTLSDNSNDLRRGRESRPSDRKPDKSRSRSKDRDKRDKSRDKNKRDRSRSRDRDRRRRERSRSRDRRDRRRDRDRSNDSDKSRERNDRFRKRDDQDNRVPYHQNDKLNNDGNNMSNSYMTGNVRPQINPWIRHPIPNMQTVPSPIIQANDPRNKPVEQPRVSRWSTAAPDKEQWSQLQNLSERRNPNAFQGGNDNPYLSNNPTGGSRPMFNNMNNHNRFPNPRMPFQPQHRPNQYNNSSNDPRQMGNRRGFCIQMKNVQSQVGYGDIRRFFGGHFISNQGLKFIQNDQGRRSGIVYVKFESPGSKQEALNRSGEMFKGSKVYISHISEDEFNEAIDSYQSNRDNHNDRSGDDSESNSLIILDDEEKTDEPFKILLLKDLPSFAKEHDIMKMFSDYSLLSINMDVSKDGKKQICAYVQFLNADDAKAALENTSKHLIGHKIINVAPCSEKTYEKALKNGDDYENDEEEDEESKNSNNTRDPRQRRYDKPGWGDNQRNSRFSSDYQQRSGSGNQNDDALDCLYMKGLPYRVTNEDIYNFFSDLNIAPTKTHLMLSAQGQPYGEGYCEFLNAEDAAIAATKNGSAIGTNHVCIEVVSRNVVMDALNKTDNNYGPPNRGGFRGRGNFRGRVMMRGRGMFNPNFRGPPPMGGRFPGPPIDPYAVTSPPDFGAPGCVLALENVPFWATIPEIIDFFDGFDLTENDVIRRFDDGGNPTGDVRVRFKSHFDTKKAHQQNNNKLMRNRTITTSIV